VTSRGLVALGIGQCVNWGVLYYSFGVLLLPVQRALGAPRWIVAGAFSVALLMSAAIAPTIGRWTDRGRGPDLMQTGGFAAAALLALWAAVPTLWISYLVWAGLGLCMAAVLYEPAFAIVGQALENDRERLRALASITVFGGLASTIFLPFTAALIEYIGWRAAVWTLACILAISTAIVSHAAFGSFRNERSASLLSQPAMQPPPVRGSDMAPRGALARLLLLFCIASLTSTGLTTILIPALVDRGVQPTTAGALAGLYGVMQLPGRTLLMNRRFSTGPSRLLLVSLLFQSLGLTALTVGQSLPAVGAGIALFASGAGLTSLVRPHFVQTVFGVHSGGHINGLIAGGQQLARAAGPVLATGLATLGGHTFVFGLFAALLGVAAVSWRWRWSILLTSA
jgi:hypothetical protein